MPTERAAYSVPWTEGNFIDSIAAGYHAELLLRPDGRLIGYWLAMPGVDEMHLLNITVAPEFQRGVGPCMLDRHRCMRSQRLNQLWLEVRVSTPARRTVPALRLHPGRLPPTTRQRAEAVKTHC